MLKTPRYKNRKYLDWVKSQPCCVCGAPADDPHHIIGVGNMSGMGLKAPDWAVMPMCRGHHNEIHSNPDMWADQWELALRTIGMAIEDGVL